MNAATFLLGAWMGFGAGVALSVVVWFALSILFRKR